MRVTQALGLLAAALLARGASADVLGRASTASLERRVQETGTYSYSPFDYSSGSYAAARPDFTTSIYPSAAEMSASEILEEPKGSAQHKRVTECACVGHSKFSAVSIIHGVR